MRDAIETSVPVEDLRAAGFGDEVEKVATAVAAYLDDGTGGNVAVVSDPYAGRDAVLEYAESLLDEAAVRVDLDPSAADGDGPTLPEGEADEHTREEATGDADAGDGEDATDDGAGAGEPEGATDDVDGAGGTDGAAGALVVANCHYLFERRIDGFATLDAFLERIALSDALVVTSWNRHAWSYLDAVRDVGGTFTTRVEIPRLDAAEIETVVEAHYGPDLPEVVDTGSAGRVKTVVFDGREVRLPRGRSVTVPYPKLNPAWTASWSVEGDEESVEAVVYEKLRRVSHGNPGVALSVWTDSVTDGAIAPGYVESFETDLALDDDAAAVLWSVLTAESADVDRVSATYPRRPVEASLQDLAERGLVRVDGDRVSVPPRAIHLAAAALERKGMLW